MQVFEALASTEQTGLADLGVFFMNNVAVTSLVKGNLMFKAWDEDNAVFSARYLTNCSLHIWKWCFSTFSDIPNVLMHVAICRD